MAIGFQQRRDRRRPRRRENRRAANSSAISTFSTSSQPSAVSPFRRCASGAAEQQRFELSRHAAARGTRCARWRADQSARAHVQSTDGHGRRDRRESNGSVRRESSAARSRPCAAPDRHRVNSRDVGGRQQIWHRQQRQHLEQRGILQPPVAAAAHQLHRLHDEFDFANAARSQA